MTAPQNCGADQGSGEQMTPGRRVPLSFREASMYCTLPMNEAFPRFAFALQLADKSVVRVHIAKKDVRFLLQGIKDVLPELLLEIAQPLCQSSSESGSPSVDESTPSGSDQV